LLANGDWQGTGSAERYRSGERWQIRNDGLVVSDTATGLVWDRCTWGQSGSACEGNGELFTEWSDALRVADIANQRRYKGAYDWRVPNARELETLIKIDRAWSTIDTAIFPNTPPECYWTSSQSWLISGFSIDAWIVRFRDGLVTPIEKTVDPEMYPGRSFVRLVRGGQPAAATDGVSERLFFADFDGPPKLSAAH
jgi:hypothetical protein